MDNESGDGGDHMLQPQVCQGGMAHATHLFPAISRVPQLQHLYCAVMLKAQMLADQPEPGWRPEMLGDQVDHQLRQLIPRPAGVVRAYELILWLLNRALLLYQAT